MAKVLVSKKYIISIEKFMDDYFNLKYDGEEKLTHMVMKNYLISKEVECPKYISYKKVNKEGILTGNIVVVKDKAGQVYFYQNPYNLNKLYMELSRIDKIEEARRKRKEILMNMNCAILLDEDEYEITDKVNRQKKLLRK